MKKQSILRYRADIRSVLTVFGIVAMSLFPFIVSMPWWGLILYGTPLLFFIRSYAPYIQHNHGHLPIFRSQALNWGFDVLLAQCTGYPTALWELHHSRGHHRHFLTPENDVARIIDLRTGLVVSRWWYALNGNLTIVPDSIKIAKAEAKAGGKNLLPKLYFELGVQVAITGALLFWNPSLCFWFFISQNLAMAWFIWWESYQHHLDVPTTNAYDGSVTITNRWFNFQTFNIGHHTAHHEKPTLHWSLLPERTQKILNRIPQQCLQEEYHFFAKPIARPKPLQPVTAQH